MRKPILIALITLTSYCCTSSQFTEDSLFPINIPQRVKYTRPTKQAVTQARVLLEKTFVSNEKTELFGDVVMLYPSIWSEVKDLEPYKSDQAARFTSYVDGHELNGKGLKSDDSKLSLIAHLQKKFAKQTSTTIRPPDYDDLQKYWAIIGWDLDSPLFVIENKEYKYIFEFLDGHIFTVFDLNSMKL